MDTEYKHSESVVQNKVLEYKLVKAIWIFRYQQRQKISYPVVISLWRITLFYGVS
jgi:hypothetical protein